MKTEETFQFEPRRFTLDAGRVADYLKAVGDDSDLYQRDGLVPSMAVAALAMGALADGLHLPPGSIHIAQEFEFSGAVSPGETVTCIAKPGRRVDRGQMHLMSLDIEVMNHDQKRVLGGKVTFMLPQAGKA